MTDTYGRSILLGASRRRYEDALALHSAKRWTGAIYLGGYVIECLLISLICYTEDKKTFTETKKYQNGLKGAALHNIRDLLKHADLNASLMIALDATGALNEACNTVVELWKKDELRYGHKVGNEKDSKRFMDAVKVLRYFIEKRLDQFKSRRKFYG